MSVVSKNPFDLLGDGDDSSPSPAPKAPAASAQGAKKAPNASEGTVRNVPGAGGNAANAGARGGAARGGRYPSRGGARNVYRNQEDKGPRNTAQEATEGFETAGGFDGERVAPPKRAHHGPDKHTKGPRADRAEQTSGGHKSRGNGAYRGSKTPAFGGERRQFERRSGTVPDSQKKVDQGWGANEGSAELTAEVEGEKDAQAEGTAPGTPAADGGWGASDETAAATGFEDAPAAAADETPAEPEEVQKSYDEFLAEKAAQAFAFGKKEARQVNSETVEGKAFVREGIDDFFSGKEKTTAAKAKAAKKEKVYIEVDGQFAQPAGSRPPREDRPQRGGRGGGRGRGEGRGRGGPRGGAGRGGFGGNNARSNNASAANISDEKAFPALGA